MIGGGRWRKRCAPFDPDYPRSSSTITAWVRCSGEDLRRRRVPGGSVVGNPDPGVVRHAVRSHAARLRRHLRFHAEYRELHRHVVRQLCLLLSDQHSVHRSDRPARRERSGDVSSPSPRSGNARAADSGQHSANGSSCWHVRGWSRGPHPAPLRKPTRRVLLLTTPVDPRCSLYEVRGEVRPCLEGRERSRSGRCVMSDQLLWLTPSSTSASSPLSF